MRPTAVLFAIVAAIAPAACGDLGQVISLQQGIAREFNTQAVSVNINAGKYLTVVFSTSAAGSVPDSEQAVFVLHVAEYVRDHYPGYNQLQAIRVGFGAVTGVGPIRHTDTKLYSFNPRDLGPPRKPSDEPTH